MDDESQLVANGLAAFDRIREERDQYKALAESFERSSTIATAELEALRAHMSQVEAQAEFYRRHAIELKSWLEAAGDMIEKVLIKSKQGAYRPTFGTEAHPNGGKADGQGGPAPTSRQFLSDWSDTTPAIPPFLTKGPAQ